jgi:predicted nucleic-acid-binding Zn-ribbon protein
MSIITLCRYCGSTEIFAKEIEIRSINASTMKVTSSERVTELECRYCGWVGCQDLSVPVGAF